MSHSVEEKVAAIINWAGEKENSWFNGDFVDDMQIKLEKGEELSDNQVSGIDNIVNKLEIDVGYWSD